MEAGVGSGDAAGPGRRSPRPPGAKVVWGAGCTRGGELGEHQRGMKPALRKDPVKESPFVSCRMDRQAFKRDSFSSSHLNEK